MLVSARQRIAPSTTEVNKIDILLRTAELTDLCCATVMYEGQCRDLYEDGLCALGERLFLRNGAAQCDCAEVVYSYLSRFYDYMIIISGLAET